MQVADYMKQMKKGSKKDDLPGTVEGVLDEKCPNCGKNMKLYKKCCGYNFGYKGCSCGFKIVLSGGSNGSDS